MHQYFNSLSEEVIPFIGSAGEQRRMNQLMRQLPLQDSDIQYCHDLNSEEKRQHLDYNSIRKREALGRGTVRQLPVTLKSSSCTKVSSVFVLVMSCPYFEVTSFPWNRAGLGIVWVDGMASHYTECHEAQVTVMIYGCVILCEQQ